MNDPFPGMCRKTGLIVFCLVLIAVASSHACIGRKFVVGTTGSAENLILAEMISVFVSERTGTTVEIQIFPDDKLYEAFSKNRIGMFIENTAAARERLNLNRMQQPDELYESVKNKYRELYRATWLEPFHLKGDGKEYGKGVLAPVVSYDILSDFPGLPRLLNKLAEKIGREEYENMVARVADGQDPKQVAREYLDAIKLI